jgi:hypothetical protein
MQSDDDDFTSSSPQRIHFVHWKRGYFFKWREAVCPPIVKKAHHALNPWGKLPDFWKTRNFFVEGSKKFQQRIAVKIKTQNRYL